MKPYVLVFFLGILPASAPAQVVINQAALEQLAGISPPVTYVPAPEVAPAAVKPKVHHVAHKAAPPKPELVIARPETGPAAPSAVPVVARPAPPKLVAVPPVVLNFGAGSTSLPANAAAALKPVCSHAMPDGIVGIDAYAAGAGTDPSAPMRLSLGRAFAVRDALTACGIPAANIVPRANGAASGANANTARITVTPP